MVKFALELIARCLVYSLVVMFMDFIAVLLFTQKLDQIVPYLSLVMLAEGGVGLTVGGAIVLYSPIGSKIGEIIFHSEPWSAKRGKEAEKQAKTWIVTGSILVFAALLVSAL